MQKELTEQLLNIGVLIKAEQLAAIEVYVAELLKWNASINLTAITNIQEIYEKHIYDCLSVIPYLNGITELLDIGSGAGLPGILIALICPDIHVISIESVGKKVNFQKHIKRKLNLDNFIVQQCRAEKLAIETKKYQASISRAFSSLKNFIEISEHIIEKKIISMKGPEGVEEIAQLQNTHIISAYNKIELYDYELPRSRARRSIIILTR